MGVLAVAAGLTTSPVVPPVADPIYDADAVALFARMTVQPDAARKQLYSDMFVAGKQKSFWAKSDAIWVHAAHHQQAGRLNWLGAIYDCIPFNNPAFTTDRGFLPDGSSSYLDTMFNPATAVGAKHSQNSGSLGIRANTDNGAAASSLAGFYNGSTGVTINPKAASNPTNGMTGRMHQSSVTQAAAQSSTSAAGLYVVNRTASNVIKCHREGVVVSNTNTAASVAPANGNYRLGSITDSIYRSQQFSMGFVGAGLTDQEVTDIFNWFETWRLALGFA